MEAYPLQRPPAWPRTEEPQWSRFDATQNEAQVGLHHELQLLGASDVVISTNIPLRRDGLPASVLLADDIERQLNQGAS